MLAAPTAVGMQAMCSTRIARACSHNMHCLAHIHLPQYTGMQWLGNSGTSIDPVLTSTSSMRGIVGGRRMLTLGPLLSAEAGAVNAANMAVQPKFAGLAGAAMAMGMPAVADVINRMGMTTMAASGMAMGALTNPALNGPVLGRRLLTGPFGGFLKVRDGLEGAAK